MEQSSNALALELKAMAAIGQILGDLPDATLRRRVLKWADERFAGEGVVLAMRAREADAFPVLAALTDPGLTIDSLDDMFASQAAEEMDDDLGEFDPRATPPPDVSKLPLETVLRSFATDFQHFVDEWNGATA